MIEISQLAPQERGNLQKFSPFFNPNDIRGVQGTVLSYTPQGQNQFKGPQLTSFRKGGVVNENNFQFLSVQIFYHDSQFSKFGFGGLFGLKYWHVLSDF